MKKLYYLLFAFFALFFVSSQVYAVSVQGCESVGIDIDSKITNAVHLIILIIQVAVPVLLVIFGSIDFVKAIVQSKEDEIKKGQQTFIKRLIAGILVFFVIAIVKLIVSFAAEGNDKNTIVDCVNCFLSGASDDGSCK